jgi:hypothetical protein
LTRSALPPAAAGRYRAQLLDERRVQAESGGDRRREPRGCRRWLVPGLLAPPALAALLWEWQTTVTIEPIATGDGRVAFLRRVDYAWPADADTSLWLGRSLADRSTWHRLAPTARCARSRSSGAARASSRSAAPTLRAPTWCAPSRTSSSTGADGTLRPRRGERGRTRAHA